MEGILVRFRSDPQYFDTSPASATADALRLERRGSGFESRVGLHQHAIFQTSIFITPVVQWLECKTPNLEE